MRNQATYLKLFGVVFIILAITVCCSVSAKTTVNYEIQKKTPKNKKKVYETNQKKRPKSQRQINK